MHHKHQHPSPTPPESDVSRRDFLRLAGAAAAGLAVAACQKQEEMPAVTVQENAPAASGPKPRVAIAQADSYDPDLIDKKMWEMIDQLGGLSDVVKAGDSVAIKVNMTGGTKSGKIPGYKEIETFITHPQVVWSLIKQIQVAGAKDIYIVEAAYEWESYTQWGYEEVAEATDATLIDLNSSKPYDDFIDAPVGENSFIYPTYTINKLLTEVDVFMSVSKMKNHYEAGVTHTMKNLFGLVPYRFYRLNPGDSYRSGFHGQESQTKARIPRIIVDLNRARPIHFGLVDGIMTTEGGEGPWISTINPLRANVLVAGKNPVATDAVATAVMGHDPTGNYPDAPFYRCENHLNIAASMGLGTNKLDEIEVVGASIETVKKQFHGAE